MYVELLYVFTINFGTFLRKLYPYRFLFIILLVYPNNHAADIEQDDNDEEDQEAIEYGGIFKVWFSEKKN